MSTKHYEPEFFLHIASRLINDDKYEERGRVRTAIGRAYYAAFLSVQKKLIELGKSFNDTSKIHKQVIEELTSIKPHMGDQLSALFDKRVDADYHLDAFINKQTGMNSIKIATKLLREMQFIKNSP